MVALSTYGVELRQTKSSLKTTVNKGKILEEKDKTMNI